MRTRSIMLILFMISSTQLVHGQQKNNGYEKVIRIIGFFGAVADTRLVVEQYNSSGDLIEKPSKSEAFSAREIFPVKIDTSRSLDGKTMIEYLWEDKSRTRTYEIETKTNKTRIGLDRNGIDTTFFSSFSQNRKGFLTEGIVINHGDTTIYNFRGKHRLNEIQKIRSNILNDTEFRGIVSFNGNKTVTVADLRDSRNKIKIKLNRQLQPTKIIIDKFHPDHNSVFRNKIYYKYQKGKLTEMRNYNDQGDIEMTKEINYNWK